MPFSIAEYQSFITLYRNCIDQRYVHVNALRHFDASSPAEKTVTIIEQLLNGEEVEARDLIDLRDAIITDFGSNLRQPMHLTSIMRSCMADEEVNRSLMNLLSNQQVNRVRERGYAGTSTNSWGSEGRGD